MKDFIKDDVARSLFMAIVGGLLVGVLLAISGPTKDEQLEELKQMNSQLQKIHESNDRIEQTIKDIRETSYIPKPAAIRPAVVQGRASVYSERGCLGCSDDLIMANGERLDDRRATVALACRWSDGHCYLALPLGTSVTVQNQATGRVTAATVTDTFGGIYGRVADLSLATANAVDCFGLCEVTISI